MSETHQGHVIVDGIETEEIEQRNHSRKCILKLILNLSGQPKSYNSKQNDFESSDSFTVRFHPLAFHFHILAAFTPNITSSTGSY